MVVMGDGGAFGLLQNVADAYINRCFWHPSASFSHFSPIIVLQCLPDFWKEGQALPSLCDMRTYYMSRVFFTSKDLYES